MDKNEKIAEAFLKRNFALVEFEPISGKTPDFLCDKKIAVEVRQLNQHHEENGILIGLESTEIPLARTLDKIYSEYKSPTPTEGWFVHHEFWRPIPTKKEVETFTRATIENFLSKNNERTNHKFQIGTLRITMTPKSLIEHDTFVMEGWTDHDSGGFIEAEIGKNLEICTIEKSQKIQKNKNMYPMWWLVLIDRIGEANTKPDMNNSTAYMQARSEFDRVLLLSPDGLRTIDV